ncbi:hypothetical protein SISNIDRAFT_456739 [Sistotremastrum niveocremeum HHB9708]|uniref:G domain-containing protein n=1 Tax=Sistotremastrum niveocremeum HHB9708 TaxID=1314777 RepID=A0A164SIG9_9AGAM|nr:hypothetical protein SISNIDRAFT_456739 [Sistotremastrum niveocremeum HHB9708]
MPSLGSFGMRNVLVKKRYVNIDRFRVLIIGKTGCGKTTILEKFCGGKISDAPSETRGGHDIDKQLVSENNASFVAHDSCGFEAGQEDEFRRVLKFIERRENEKPTEQVHVIWYCVQANSRPIQAAEKMFFSTKHGSIPVVAVLTKFDTLINTCKQELMAKFDEDDDEMDDDVYDALEADAAMQAEIEAQDKFEKHYRKPLLAMPYPPSDVVKLSNVHKAADAVLSLRQLTAATWNSLRLSNFDAMMLFAVAQQTFVHSYHRETFTLQGAEHLTDAKLAEKRTKIFSLEDEVSLDQSSVKAVRSAPSLKDFYPRITMDRLKPP